MNKLSLQAGPSTPTEDIEEPAITLQKALHPRRILRVFAIPRTPCARSSRFSKMQLPAGAITSRGAARRAGGEAGAVCVLFSAEMGSDMAMTMKNADMGQDEDGHGCGD